MFVVPGRKEVWEWPLRQEEEEEAKTLGQDQEEENATADHAVAFPFKIPRHQQLRCSSGLGKLGACYSTRTALRCAYTRQDSKSAQR